jgi:hypothetical protein
MKNFILIFLFLIVTNYIYSQQNESNYYQLYKGGEKFLKPIRYLNSENSSTKIDTISGFTYFYLEGERFIHNPMKHTIEKISKEKLDTIEVNSVRELDQEIDEIYKEKSKDFTQKHEIKLPPPLHANWLKIFIITDNQNKVCEVIWDSYGK